LLGFLDSAATWLGPRFCDLEQLTSVYLPNPHISVTNADNTFYSAKKEFDALSEIADLVVPKSTSRKEFIEECESGAFEGVVAAYRTFDSVTITGRVDSELMESLPRSLRFIAHNGM
jgi:hypothetical protein